MPVISNITKLTDNIPINGMFEVSFDIDTPATNYFFVYDTTPSTGITSGIGITVDGLFSVDSWVTSSIIPAFEYQGYSSNLATGNGSAYSDEGNQPTGTAQWRLRFPATASGTWEYKIRALDASGLTTTSGETFTVTSSSLPSFVKESTTDSRYLKLDDGTVIIGQGIGLYSRLRTSTESASTMAILSGMGINYARAIITPLDYAVPFGGFSHGGRGYPQWGVQNGIFKTSGGPDGGFFSFGEVGGISSWQNVYLTSGTTYTLTGYVKSYRTDAGTAGWFQYTLGTASASVSGLSDWTQISLDFTPDSTGNYAVTVTNSGGGYYWCHWNNFSVKVSGTTSGEYLAKGTADVYKYIDQREAARVDNIFQYAQDNGVYLLVSITEKTDPSLGRLSASGTAEDYNIDNVYANETHPSRWYQQCWWRYFVARWGAYRSLLTVEYADETDSGATDPTLAYNATLAMGSYISSAYTARTIISTVDPGRSIPCSLWASSAMGMVSSHYYIGYYGSGKYWWPGWDGFGIIPLYTTVEYIGGDFSWDTDNFYSGTRSVKSIWWQSAPSGIIEQNSYLSGIVGAVAGHEIQIDVWAKVSNFAPYVDNDAVLRLTYSTSGTDTIYSDKFTLPSGTYTWTKFTSTYTVPSTATDYLILRINPSKNKNTLTPSATAWIDNIIVTDVTTNTILNYNGGFDYPLEQNYDIIGAHAGFSQTARSFQFGKPYMRGEWGIMSGGVSTYEDQNVALDTDGIWWKKAVWSSLCPGNSYALYWWTDNLFNHQWDYQAKLNSFISDIPVSNGYYSDLQWSTDCYKLRCTGQVDTTHSRAHFLLDNIDHTWSAVVSGTTITPTGGTITLSGLSAGPHIIEYYDTSTGTKTSTETLTCSDGTLNLAISNFSTDIAVKVYYADYSGDLVLIFDL